MLFGLGILLALSIANLTGSVLFIGYDYSDKYITGRNVLANKRHPNYVSIQ